jgi:hypothetical protein
MDVAQMSMMRSFRATRRHRPPSSLGHDRRIVRFAAPYKRELTVFVALVVSPR